MAEVFTWTITSSLLYHEEKGRTSGGQVGWLEDFVCNFYSVFEHMELVD